MAWEFHHRKLRRARIWFVLFLLKEPLPIFTAVVCTECDWKPIVISRAGSVLPMTPYCRGIGRGHISECPLQVCHLSTSSESTHFLSLRRGVALLVSTRPPEDFWERRHVTPFSFLTITSMKRQPYHTKTGQIYQFKIITGLSRP